MIEPTPEMVREFRRVALAESGGIEQGLAAVLAIVERDYRLTCPAEIDHERGTLQCIKDAGHAGGHRGEHPSAGVFWS